MQTKTATQEQTEEAPAESVNMEAEKTIKEIVEERQEQLKDLEQLQDMK